jgi:KUP system potassium uptake protein
LVPLDFAWLTISSLGIVYGDLGTSPLYTWPTILSNLETYEEDDLVGAMCLLLYSLLAIVTIKYATFVMMADNKGEGGIFALTALVPPTRKHVKAWKRGGDPPPRYMVWTKRACMCLCIIGAGFIMGDGAITPAVSVLSAIEGKTTAHTAHTGAAHTTRDSSGEVV